MTGVLYLGGAMTRDTDPMPVIARKFTDVDRKIEVLRTSYDTVSFTRGLGDHGYRLQVVDHECPKCTHDRLFRKIEVYPEESRTARYWCLSPSCPHYVSDEFSYVGPTRRPTEPVVSGFSEDSE